MCMHVSIVTILFQPKLFLCHMHTARYTWRTLNRKNNDIAKNWCLHDFFGFPFDFFGFPFEQRFHRANLQNNWINRINDNNSRSKKSQTIHQTIEWMNETHARILHKNEAHSDFVIANLNIIDREVDMWTDKCYGLSAAAACLLLHACDVRVNLCDFSLYCHHFRFFYTFRMCTRARGCWQKYAQKGGFEIAKLCTLTTYTSERTA